jgi:DNA-binding winged helix-turn-helix (wHTH) protein/TolB-like protein/Tfp pilus assembly protein PilF
MAQQQLGGSSAGRVYAFAGYRLDLGRVCLSRDGEEIRLRPKSFDVLRHLVERSGQVVSKDELFAHVWRETAVTEDALVQCLVDIRRALGEEGRNLIRTVPRRGYLFDADVESVDARPAAPPLAPCDERVDAVRVVIDGQAPPSIERVEGSSSLPLAALALPAPRPRATWRRATIVAAAVLALVSAVTILLLRRTPAAPSDGSSSVLVVLPFQPMVAGAPDEYLELGMADAVIGKLAHVRQIVVRPTSAVRRYTAPDRDPFEIARALGADSVLEGSVQRDGDRLRVTVQLSNTGDRRALWAGTFDEPYTGIFSVQDAISERVARALEARLTGEEQTRIRKRYTENTEAYHLYLRGRYFWERRTVPDLQKAIDYFNEAIRLDSSYALAYAGIAQCYGPLGHLDYIRPGEALAGMRAAASKAVELDDSLAEAQTALGALLGFHEWDFAASERAFRRAIELNPNFPTAYQWYGLLLNSLGRQDEALAVRRRAVELDPLGVNANISVSMSLLAAGRVTESIALAHRVLELDPGFGLAHTHLGMAYLLNGAFDEAIAELRQGHDRTSLAWAFARAGRSREAREALADLKRQAEERYVSPLAIGLIHAALGETDEAFGWIERAYETRVPAMHQLTTDVRWEPLRGDPRYAALVERMGLTVAARTSDDGKH